MRSETVVVLFFILGAKAGQCLIEQSKLSYDGLNKVAKIIMKHPQKVNKWMKRYMLDFYKKKNSVEIPMIKL